MFRRKRHKQRLLQQGRCFEAGNIDRAVKDDSIEGTLFQELRQFGAGVQVPKHWRLRGRSAELLSQDRLATWREVMDAAQTKNTFVRSVALPRHLLHGLHFLQNNHGMTHDGQPDRGWPKVLRRALEKLDAQLGFQVLDGNGKRGLAHATSLGRVTKVLFPGQ